MLPTCHSIPGAQVYLKRLAKTSSRLWRLWLKESPHPLPHTLSLPLSLSVPSATFMGISATYVVCCVQEHFSSTLRPSERGVHACDTLCSVLFTKKDGSGREGEEEEEVGTLGAVIVPHLNFWVAYTKFHTKIHFFSLWISLKAHSDSCSCCSCCCFCCRSELSLPYANVYSF